MTSRSLKHSVQLAFLLLSVTPLAASAQTMPGTIDTAKVKSLIAQMTLEEKMGLIRGEAEPEATNQGQAGWLPGVKRLGIPPLRMSDGPPGILTRIPSAAETATMGLAATFSREDARLNGTIIADEAISHSIDVVLEPFVNIDRDITFSRGYNTYGEDPVLSGAISADFIKGVQSRGVMAQVKHYIGYDTNASDVTIDLQTLHEVNLAPFDDAVRAGVSSVMCSYNRINGPYACGNKEMLVDILRGELGFDGYVTSDWGAVHGNGFLANGLDMEMPGLPAPGSPFAVFMKPYFSTTPPPQEEAKFDFKSLPPIFSSVMPEEPVEEHKFTGIFGSGNEPYKNLWNALQDGTASEAMIDRAASRVLGQIERFGYLDGRHAAVIKTPSGLDITAVIRKTSADAAVLLKNEGGVLPLEASAPGPVVLIGPSAAQVAAIGKSGERSVGLPERQVGPYDALVKAMPGSDLRLEIANDMNGSAVPAEFLSFQGKPGLQHSIDGKIVGIDAQIDFTRTKALAANTTHVWEGDLVITKAGAYRLYLQLLGTRARLYVDGKAVAGSSGFKGGVHGDILQAGQDGLFPTPDGLDNVRVKLDLAAGKHALRIETQPDTSNAPEQLRLAWVTPEKTKADFEAAIAAAKIARTAVVFVWSRDIPVFAIPGDQNELVEKVAAVNPNTIVVLNVSQPVAMPWLDKVKAVVQMWWPGDEGGWSTADILSGRKNPAGRLPFTWAKTLQDYAANDPAHPERAGNNADGKARFSEGVDVGYRWFDRTGKAPLYPFGYGLSYTSFAYSNLNVTKAKDGGLDVAVTLKNTGNRDGEEVPQVYVSAPAKQLSGVQFAKNALAGFYRVLLKAGETKRVAIHIERRRTQYWSVTAKKWIDAAATRTVSVGASSRDLRLSAVVK